MQLRTGNNEGTGNLINFQNELQQVNNKPKSDNWSSLLQYFRARQ